MHDLGMTVDLPPASDPLRRHHAAAWGLVREFYRRPVFRRGTETAAAIEPRPQDFERVFAKDIASQARRAYEPFWQSRPSFGPHDTASVERLAVAVANDFVNGGPRSERFPAGYRSIASGMSMNIVWACFTMADAHGRESVVDGLAYLDERWAWFPRPWEYLA